MKDFLWWRDGIIYQIYPRSFSDTTRDGLGDLPGVTARLDYLAALGIDAIWLSPFYPTPDKDFGYDVADHTAVDERFGSMADFDALVEAAHGRGIRIVLDLVLNHTSNEHPWFLESRASPDNPRRDWYIWRKGRGRTPNNWQATFGGSAWTHDPQTDQCYLHLFTREQPDVNWRSPAVRQAQLDVVRFWLERGVDGFRLDVFNAYFKDETLRDNPPKFGLRGFDRQRHVHDINQPEMIPMLQELRMILDSYPERYAVGETFISPPEVAVTYCGDDKLHAAFSFDFTPYSLLFPWYPSWVMKRIMKRERIFAEAGIWPTTVMSNHDIPRAAARYSRGEDDGMAKIVMTLLLTLRGTPFMYYGEEIGMRDVPLRRHEIMDPPGKKYWPIYKGRDGCRSPMQWDNSPNAGFSSTQPWMKLNADYPKRNAAAQDTDPTSMLNFTRSLIALRRANPALVRGDFIPLESTSKRVMAYMRKDQDQTVLVLLNFSGRSTQSRRHTLPGNQWKLLLSTAREGENIDIVDINLAPYEVCIFVSD